MEKPVVLSALINNRNKHDTEYMNSLKEYRKELREVLEDMLEQVNEGEDVDHFIKLEKPESFCEEYDLVIAMLESSIDTHVELDHEEYKKYILNNWEWSNRFKHLTEMYTKQR